MATNCASCSSTILFGGKKENGNTFCNDICLEIFRHPDFCSDCRNETIDESPGGTFTFNGIGTHLYGWGAKCPQCSSVVKRKWFCFAFIPVIPLAKFRIKKVTSSKYIGRKF